MTEVTQKTIKALESMYLPKWPQMFVWGTAVTTEQAKDIILRTDGFLSCVMPYCGGNNKRWNSWARDILGLAQHAAVDTDWTFQSQLENALREELGYVDTEYVRNSWASCAFIYGPHGWVHPNGKIWYADNIGKDPCAREVFEEWQALAKAFPYLDLTVTLMSGEGCEDDSEPVVSFRAKEGAVSVMDAALLPPNDAVPEPRDMNSAMLAIARGDSRRELGLPDEQIVEYGIRTNEILARIAPAIRAKFPLKQ